MTDTRSGADTDTTKENELLTHDLIRLKAELDSPRLSALRSTLGLAVPRAALRSLGSGTATSRTAERAPTLETATSPGHRRREWDRPGRRRGVRR